MQTTNPMLNGVDLKKFVQTIETFITKPRLAKFQFRLNNEWIDGGRNQSIIKDFYRAGAKNRYREVPFVVANDQPDILFGTDNAPNPAEFVLHALAGCLTTSLVYHAAALGYEITKVQTAIEGELDLRGFLGIDHYVRKGYEEIKIAFDIEGNFSEEEKKELLKLTSFSPVLDMISNPVPVKINLKVKETAAEIDC